MTHDDFTKRLWGLVKAADDLGLPDTKDMIVNAAMSMLYPSAVQKALAKECSDATKKWAKRLREAMAEQGEKDDREWFRDFEWPEDLA